MNPNHKSRSDEAELISADRQSGGTAAQVIGYLCRSGLVFLCLNSFLSFLTDSLALEVSGSSVFLWSLLPTVWFCAMGISKWFFLGGTVLTAGAGLLFLRAEKVPDILIFSATSLYNAFFRRLDALGYAGMKRYVLDFTYSLKQLHKTEADCQQLAFSLIAILLGAVIAVCLIKRTRLIPLILIGAVLCTVSLYYGLAPDNSGLALILSVFAGLLALSAYDRIYLKKRVIRQDAAPSEAPAGQRAEYLRRFRAGSAMGGFTGLGAALLTLLLFFFPAKVKNSMKDIPSISQPALKIENYLNAVAQGDEPDLSSMLFSGASLDSRSTAAQNRHYTGEKIFEVMIDNAVPVYLRSWTGADYSEDSWHSPEYDKIAEYRRLFGEDFTPERMTSDLLYAMNPSLVELPETSGYKSHLEYGYVTEQVHIKKQKPTNNMIFMPSYSNQRLRLMEHGSRTPIDLHYVNYYDGIYTSAPYLFLDDYSTIAQLPLLRDREFAYNLGELMSYFDGQAACIAQYQMLRDSGLSGNELTDAYENAVSLLSITYARRGIPLFGETPTGVSSAQNDALWYRYAYDMDDEQRAVVDRLLKDRQNYQNYVYANYMTVSEGAAEFRDLAAGILNQNDFNRQLIEFFRTSPPSDYAFEFSLRDMQVMAIIDYLSENMTYTLEAKDPDPERPYLNAAETFLFDTKEGYCVQFATSAVMMLRTLGIPARYAEGYIADEFIRLTDKNAAARYITTVRDYDAHAWIEVYYDGYGWVQYEATSAYYDDMYRPYQAQVSTHYTAPDPDDLMEEEPEDPTDIDTETEDEPLLQTLLPVLIVLLAAAVCVTFFILWLKKRAERAETRRSALLKLASERVLDNGTRMKLAAEFNELILRLLAFRRLSPQPGEHQHAFAERVEGELGQFTHESFSVVSDAMMAGEFALSIPRERLDLLADYARELHDYIARGSNVFGKLYLHYFYLPSCKNRTDVV